MARLFELSSMLGKLFLGLSGPISLLSIPAAMVVVFKEWGDWRLLGLVVFALMVTLGPVKTLSMWPASIALNQSWTAEPREAQVWALVGQLVVTVVSGASLLIWGWVVYQAGRSLGWI